MIITINSERHDLLHRRRTTRDDDVQGFSAPTGCGAPIRPSSSLHEEEGEDDVDADGDEWNEWQESKAASCSPILRSAIVLLTDRPTDRQSERTAAMQTLQTFTGC